MLIRNRTVPNIRQITTHHRKGPVPDTFTTLQPNILLYYTENTVETEELKQWLFNAQNLVKRAEVHWLFVHKRKRLTCLPGAKIIGLPISSPKNKQTNRQKLNTRKNINIHIWISPGHKMRGRGSNRKPPTTKVTCLCVCLCTHTKKKKKKSWKHYRLHEKPLEDS